MIHEENNVQAAESSIGPTVSPVRGVPLNGPAFFLRKYWFPLAIGAVLLGFGLYQIHRAHEEYLRECEEFCGPGANSISTATY